MGTGRRKVLGPFDADDAGLFLGGERELIAANAEHRIQDTGVKKIIRMVRRSRKRSRHSRKAMVRRVGQCIPNSVLKESKAGNKDGHLLNIRSWWDETFERERRSWSGRPCPLGALSEPVEAPAQAERAGTPAPRVLRDHGITNRVRMLSLAHSSRTTPGAIGTQIAITILPAALWSAERFASPLSSPIPLASTFPLRCLVIDAARQSVANPEPLLRELRRPTWPTTFATFCDCLLSSPWAPSGPRQPGRRATGRASCRWPGSADRRGGGLGCR